ncbi:unnamed protein product, partial [Effrenium voratum]
MLRKARQPKHNQSQRFRHAPVMAAWGVLGSPVALSIPALSCSVVPFVLALFFWVAAPPNMAFPKKGFPFFFARVAEQLSANPGLGAVLRSGLWRKRAARREGAVKRSLIFSDMPTVLVEPNFVTYGAALSALSRGEKWREALELFTVLPQRGVESGIISVTATLTACGRAACWQEALELLSWARQEHLQPT